MIVTDTMKRKETAWKEMLDVRDKTELNVGTINKKRKKWLRSTFWSKREVNEQFERKMNQDVGGNRKLFWKEMGEVKGGKVDGNVILVMGEDEVGRT